MIEQAALDALAVHRLTRLVTKDTITKPAREALIAHAYGGGPVRPGDNWHERLAFDENPPKLAELLTCRWCMSIWIAFGVLLVRRTRWWSAARYALALSSAATLIAQVED